MHSNSICDWSTRWKEILILFESSAATLMRIVSCLLSRSLWLSQAIYRTDECVFLMRYSLEKSSDKLVISSSYKNTTSNISLWSQITSLLYSSPAGTRLKDHRWLWILWDTSLDAQGHDYPLCAADRSSARHALQNRVFSTSGLTITMSFREAGSFSVQNNGSFFPEEYSWNNSVARALIVEWNTGWSYLPVQKVIE